MDENTLSLIAGSVLSLFFSYFPGVKGKYEKLTPDYKRVVMLVSLLVSAIGVYVTSCYGIFPTVECTREGVLGLVKVFILALVANQGTHKLSPRGNGN